MSTSHPGSTPDGPGDAIARSGQLVTSPNQQMAANTPWMPPTSGWLDPAPADDGLDLLGFLHSLRRTWLPGLIVGVIIGAMVFALLYFVIPVSHEAVGMLRVKRRTTELLASKGRPVVSSDREYMTYKQTQSALLKSPYVINAALRKPGINQLQMVRDEDKPLAFMENHLSTEYPGDSEILRVSLSGEDSEQTVKLVQAVMEAYLEEIGQSERLERTQRLETLRREHRDYVGEIQEKDELVHALAAELGTSGSELAQLVQKLESNKLASMDKRTLDLQARLQDFQSQLILTQNMMQHSFFRANPFDIEETLEKYPQYMTIKLEIDQMEQYQRESAATLRPGSPSAQRFQTQINNKIQDLARVRRELEPRVVHILKRTYGHDDITNTDAIQVLQTSMAITEQQLRQAMQAQQDQEVRVKDLGGYSSDLVTRIAELQNLQETATRIASEIGSIELNLQNQPRITMVQPALIPNASNHWLKMVEVVLGSLFVFSLCVFGIALLDYSSKPLNDTSDLSGSAGLNVIGSLPSLRGGLGLFSRGSSREMVITDSIDSVRTSILFGGGSSGNIKSVVVTSAVGGEGKSTVASQLAVSFARSGRRTLLIDGDVRNPQQHAVFGLPLDRGLCEILRDDASIDEVVQATAAEGLWIMPAGQCDMASLQALAGPSIATILETVAAQFDFVIVDSGPVLTGPEAMVYGQYVDGAIVSSRRDVSRLPKVQEAFQRLQSVGVKVIGAVVNGTTAEVRATKQMIAKR